MNPNEDGWRLTDEESAAEALGYKPENLDAEKEPPDLFCRCESSLCDHNDLVRTHRGGIPYVKMCPRPVDGTIKMEFVGYCCSTCAENMCKTGGAQYIYDLKDGVWTRRG